MDEALSSLDAHIAWVQAQDDRRDAELTALEARKTALLNDKATAADTIAALRAARATLASQEATS